MEALRRFGLMKNSSPKPNVSWRDDHANTSAVDLPEKMPSPRF